MIAATARVIHRTQSTRTRHLSELARAQLGFGFPESRVRFHILRKIAKIRHLQINSPLKLAEAIFKVAAVVDDHHIVARDQVSPLRRTHIIFAVCVRPYVRFYVINTKRNNLLLDMHAHLEKRS